MISPSLFNASRLCLAAGLLILPAWAVAQAASPESVWRDANAAVGQFPRGHADLLKWEQQQAPAVAPQLTAWRLVRQYGTRAAAILDGPEAPVAADLTPREIRWLVEQEWARAPDDILWRRTKLGLRVGEQERTALAAFMGAQPIPQAAA